MSCQEDQVTGEVLRLIASMDVRNREHMMLARCMIKLLDRINQQQVYIQKLQNENWSLQQILKYQEKTFEKPRESNTLDIQQPRRLHLPVHYQLQNSKILTIGRESNVHYYQ
jgi:hypothetical protein